MLTFITSTHKPRLSECQYHATTHRRSHSNRSASPGRLLLGDAVDAASALHDVQSRYLDHLAVGEDLAQGPERLVIGGVLEGRHNDAAIGDVEVGVAECETHAVVIAPFRLAKRDHLDLTAV